MNMTIKDIEKEWMDRMIFKANARRQLEFIRTAIQSAFDATRVEKKNLLEEAKKVKPPEGQWDIFCGRTFGFNKAISYINRKQSEFMVREE